jgi:sulfite exporter TauE/SafE
VSGESGVVFAFITGMLGAVHCLGMCNGVNGGFFAGLGRLPRSVDLAAFHGMRIAVYTVLGTSGAALGRIVVQSGIVGKAQGLMMMLVGLLIVLMGLALMARAVRQARSQPFPVAVPFLPRIADRPKHLHPLLAGLFNGLVPCSLVSLVAIKAAATSDPAQAGLMMLAFGIGTLPSMVAMSLFGGFIGHRARGIATYLVAIAIVATGLWTLYQGFVVYDILRGLANW